MTLTVTDNDGATDSANTTANITEPPPPPDPDPSSVVFYDSFEVSEWNGLWVEDSQRDWHRSRFNNTEGRYGAEVDGRTSDGALTSIPIDLQGRSNATITFNWLIERWLDAGEYLAFDISTDGGNTWVEKGRLRAEIDAEDTWHAVNMDVTNISNLQLRFRGFMDFGGEDAAVDEVQVEAW